jgi:hypothetical protein
MRPQKEKESSFFMTKMNEDQKFKNLIKIGDKFLLKNNIKDQNCNKTKKSLHNGNYFI